jgi:C2 domain
VALTNTRPSFVVVSLSRQRNQTPAVKRTINPTWEPKDATFDFPIYLSLVGALGVLELVLWDKDTFKKEYLGEVALSLEDWFKDGTPVSFDDPRNEVSVHNVTQRAPIYIGSSRFGPPSYPPSHPHHPLGSSRSNWVLSLLKKLSKPQHTTIFTLSSLEYRVERDQLYLLPRLYV